MAQDTGQVPSKGREVRDADFLRHHTLRIRTQLT